MVEINKIGNSIINTLQNNFIYIDRKDVGLLFVQETYSLTNGVLCYVENNMISKIICFLNHDSIQKYINSEYDKYSNYTIDCTIQQFVFNISNNELINKLPLNLVTKNDTEDAIHLVIQYIEQFANPFFDYWQDIRNFLPFLETDDLSFIVDMFCGHGLRKKIIIWKLCNHPNFEQFIRDRIKIYENSILKEPNNKNKIKDYEDFKRFLTKIQEISPLYDWDEKYLIKKEFVI